ncbi:hypothetical protein DY000_02030607 [Brassica cretica]|uniref:Retrotransposon gag domain-containing protein n=1 Tax=Brassica cretica TaxID=69181 RepID=A0ABQ7DYF6_BRACR|nr:hypothetical protein DY000_02030607 [Brassica cretica]
MRYLRGDALVRWEGVRLGHRGTDRLTFADFIHEFDRKFAGGGITEKDLIRKFLGGMRVKIRNRCRVLTYYRLGDLVEKAVEQETGLAEE